MKLLLQFRDRLIISAVDKSKSIYCYWFKSKEEVWQQTRQSLLAFPANSLGHELGLFLQKENLHLLPKMEDHDVYHVLLNYPTTVIDEIRMQFFLLGNRKRSLYVLLTVVIGLFFVPEGMKSYFREFRKGRQASAVSRWNFAYLLREPIDVLRRQIFRQQLSEPNLFF